MKQLLINKLKELSIAEDSSYTFGQVLYTMMRPKFLKNSDLSKVSWLKDIPDNDFMTALEKAITNANNLKLVNER